MSQSATAPDNMRMKVKLAGSIPVCFSANRQSREFPANAIIASRVRMKSCALNGKVESRKEENAERSTSNIELTARSS
jgi:hypothetical protein